MVVTMTIAFRFMSKRFYHMLKFNYLPFILNLLAKTVL